MREQGGSHRAIWLEEMDFNEFFSQEITEIPLTQTNEKNVKPVMYYSNIKQMSSIFVSIATGGPYYSELLLKLIRVCSWTRTLEMHSGGKSTEKLVLLKILK